MVALGDDARVRRLGFTIVELLIVVVVIAILAAITIAAYNGITQRAKASAVSSAAEQAAKKVLTYAVTNSEVYPATLADTGVTDSGSVSYQYRVDNAATPKTFCVTATNSNVSYWASSTTATPVAGACAGHGVNGVSAITNYAMNPSVRTNTAWLGQAGSSQASATSSVGSIGHEGSTSLLRSITGTGQTGASAQTAAASADRLQLAAGERVSWSLWIYSSRAGAAAMYCDGSRVSDGVGAWPLSQEGTSVRSTASSFDHGSSNVRMAGVPGLEPRTTEGRLGLDSPTLRAQETAYFRGSHGSSVPAATGARGLILGRARGFWSRFWSCARSGRSLRPGVEVRVDGRVYRLRGTIILRRMRCSCGIAA